MGITICYVYFHVKETNIMQLRTFRNRYVGKDGRHFEIVYPTTATHERVEIHERTESIEYDRFKRRYILTTRDSEGQTHERMFTKKELEGMYSERLLRHLPDGSHYIVSVYW